MIDVLAIVLGIILTFLTVVVVHELGHFFAARMVGVKASVFSIGFGKPIWSRTDRHGVLWQITRIPAGGYVKFVGDENAASLSSAPDGPVVPGSLLSVSKSAQAWVAFAGPLANVVFTAVLLSVLPMLSGVTSYPWTIASISEDAASSMLQPGDTIHAIHGITIDPEDTPDAVLSRLPLAANIAYQIARDGDSLSVTGPRIDAPILGLVSPGSAADKAGLAVGDRLRSIDGNLLSAWSDLQDAVSASEGQSLRLIYQRGDQTHATQITPRLHDGRSLIGVGAAPLFTLATERPPLVHALGRGVTQTLDLTTGIVMGLSSAVVGQDDSCNLDGPIAIASTAGQAIQLGPETFLLFLAVISLGLGVLNLLPVPILDGGHLLLLGFEGLTGRPLGKRAQAVLFIGGVTIIVFLMIMATINDLTC